MSDGPLLSRPRLRTYYVPVPRCEACSVPYVLRWAYVFGFGNKWIYQRDCKCKAPATALNADLDEIETAPLNAFAKKPGA